MTDVSEILEDSDGEDEEGDGEITTAGDGPVDREETMEPESSDEKQDLVAGSDNDSEDEEMDSDDEEDERRMRKDEKRKEKDQSLKAGLIKSKEQEDAEKNEGGFFDDL